MAVRALVRFPDNRLRVPASVAAVVALGSVLSLGAATAATAAITPGDVTAGATTA